MFFKKNKYNLVKIAALLIHAAKIDENYTSIEKEIIKKALMNLSSVSSLESENLGFHPSDFNFLFVRDYLYGNRNGNCGYKKK